MRKSVKSTFPADKLRSSLEALRAVAHPLRMRILEYLDRHRRSNVNNLYKDLGLEQSLASQHLRVLRLAGVVIPERDGKYIHYLVDYSRVAEVAHFADVCATFFDEAELAEEALFAED